MKPSELQLPYFDVAYYFRAHQDEIFRLKLDPVSHFKAKGLRKGYSPSPLIWGSWYLKAHPDLPQEGLNPITHYLEEGWREGRSPSPLFDVRWYLARYPDVAAAGVEPLLHYIQSGAAEGRWPNYLFDPEWYERHAGLSKKRGAPSPLAHYITEGWRDGRSTHPLFDTASYLDQNKGAMEAGEIPLAHYFENLNAGDRSPHPLFDPKRYRSQAPAITDPEVDLLAHFLDVGFREGRDPHALFDVRWYLDQNHDVKQSGVNPLVHFLTHGGAEGRSPHPRFNASWYLNRYPDIASSGMNPLIHYVVRGWREERDPSPEYGADFYQKFLPPELKSSVNPLIYFLEAPESEGAKRDVGPADSLLFLARPAARPLKLLNVVNSASRLTVITDTLNEDSLLGGSADALILASHLAIKTRRTLRIVTRDGFPIGANYQSLLTRAGVPRPSSVELYSDFDTQRAGRHRLDVSEGDIFIATSWWSARALRTAGYSGKIFCLLHEVRALTQPFSDEYLAARETLSDRHLSFIVNGRDFLDRLLTMPELAHVAGNGVSFEPAFPIALYQPVPSAFVPKPTYRLMVHAEPELPGSLPAFTLELLDLAIRSGTLDTREVEISILGGLKRSVEFANGYRPTMLGRLSPETYFEHLRSVDLGVALMDGPESARVASEVAACGGVALTSTRSGGANQEVACRNILRIDLETPAHAQKTLAEALEQMRQGAARQKNYEEATLSRDWAASLRGVHDFFSDRAGSQG